MEIEEIFEKGKSLTVEFGEHEDKLVYEGLNNVQDNFSESRNVYFLKKKGFKFIYAVVKNGNGNEKWESLTINKNNFFGNELVYHNFQKKNNLLENKNSYYFNKKLEKMLSSL